jgi:uncharacterized protein (TIGR02231 family)
MSAMSTMTTSETENVAIVDVPVREVTLLEDRARVVRRGELALGAGLSRVRVEGVAPALSDKTLTGTIAAPGAMVADARVFRRLMVSFDEPGRAAEEQAATLAAELERLDRLIDELDTERILVERHAAGFEQIATMTFAELSEDVGWGRAIGVEWKQRLDQLRDAERGLRERQVELASELEERRREHQRVHERMVQGAHRQEREWAAVDLDITATEAGTYTIEIEYVVPGACWRPYHTARLMAADTSTGADAGESAGAGPGWRVLFVTDACMWQNTGEDWNDVQLILSTERASLGTSPPVLHSDIVRVKRKSEAVLVEAREQEIQTTGLGTGDDVHVAQDLPGIDDGGVVLNLRAARRSSVPADGRPYRVELARFTSDAEVELVAMPELASCVFFKSIQRNTGKGPILAGPVDLIRHSGLVGRTAVLFIAAGERFELGWGPEPDLRVRRDTEVTEEKSRLLSAWVERTHEIEVRLSNLSGREHRVTVTERIPVSEIDKVKIDIDSHETTDSERPDGNGFITWHVTLPAGGHQRIALAYTLKKHEDVVGI